MVEDQLIYGLSNFSSWLAQSETKRCIFLFDENTRTYCEPKIEAVSIAVGDFITLKSGEAHKNLGTCEKIWTQLMTLNADRNTTLINLGGGMLTDIGGFAAATFKRGIPFINIPTTLLAMVDASIGNKTGINFNGIKNQIGTFSKAQKIVIDTTFLDTLAEQEVCSGLGEVLKYGFIQEPAILDSDLGTIDIGLVKRCIEIKNEIVAQDPLESGLRQILNFGHTIGHGLEAFGHENKTPLKHGEAVALGMLAESYLSKNKTDFQKLSTVEKIILKRFGIPQWLNNPEATTRILHFIRHDKKNKDGQIKCTLLEDIAQPKTGIVLNETEVIDALKWLAKLS